MLEGSKVEILIISEWNDELTELLNAKQCIGKAPVYLSSKCYKSLQEVYERQPQGKLRVTECSMNNFNTAQNQVLYRLERLSLLGVDFSARESAETRVFILKKPGEIVGDSY